MWMSNQCHLAYTVQLGVCWYYVDEPNTHSKVEVKKRVDRLFVECVQKVTVENHQLPGLRRQL